MSNDYKNIEGWFTFAHIYDEMLEKFNTGHFVEVGCWKGASALYMCEKIKEQHKQIRFDCIDVWPIDFTNCRYGDTYFEFLKNLWLFFDDINLNSFKMKSENASKLYADQSLDFVFIDGDHSYEGVMIDLKCWYPKIKIGGYFAGHDYLVEESDHKVKQVVDDFFKNTPIEIRETSWITKKQL